MANKRTSKKSVVLSFGSLFVCMAMLVGTTFAWFTDTVTSGKNKIISGNLDIDLYYRDKEAKKYNDQLQDDESEEQQKREEWVKCNNNTNQSTLFQPDSQWEPGMVVYEEFKVVNEGSLAAKFRVNFGDYINNYVLVPVESNGSPTEWECEGSSLSDVIVVNAYGGSFEDLTKKVNEEEDGQAEEVVDVEEYNIKGREVVEKALDKGIFNLEKGVDDSTFYVGALTPKGSEEKESFKFEKLDEDDLGEENDYHEIQGASSEQVFTVVLYWKPGYSPVYTPLDMEVDDNDYNLNNNRLKASKATDEEILTEDAINSDQLLENCENCGVDCECPNHDYCGKNVLFMNFKIVVKAAQVPYESDSFDKDYDYSAGYDDSVDPDNPNIGEGGGGGSSPEVPVLP